MRRVHHLPIAGLLLVSLMSIPTLLRAQDHPNFTGTWSLVAEKSDFGAAPAPATRVDVIVHEGESLIIDRTQSTANGEAQAHFEYRTDGETHRNTVGEGELSSVLTWEDAELVITSTLTLPQGEIGILDRLSLSDDGLTLTIARRLSVPGQELVQTLVLAKQ